MSHISVIIPVYNCEQFLTRCIESIINQTYTDWEAIFINDGSKDRSGEILDKFAKQDNRIKVIHKENGGVSEARNTALELVKGKYIMFVDSDDFIHPQTMEICNFFAEKDKSDIVAFTYNRRFRTLQLLGHLLHFPEIKNIKYKNYNINNIDSFVTENIFDWATEYSSGERAQNKKWLVKHCQPWRCLYRADKIKTIRFIKGIIYEDFPWWGEVLLNTERATIINLPLYYYYPNKGSYILSSKNDFKMSSLNVAIKAAEELFQQRGTDEQKQLWEMNFLIPFRKKLEKKSMK